MIAIMAPVVVPRKIPICRGKAVGVQGLCPLGAGMGSSAISQREKYCHNGGMAFPR